MSQHTILTLAAMMLVSATAQATDVVLHEGENHLPVYTQVSATFTPATDSKVVIASADQFGKVSYQDQTYTPTYLPTQSPSNIYEIDGVTAGTTIYLSSDFVLNSLVTVTTYPIGEIIPVTLLSSSPAVGSDNFWNDNGLLNITFNKNVSLTDAQIVIGSDKYDVEIVHVSSAVSLNVGDVLNKLLNDGVLSPGGRFMVTLHGVCDAADHSNLYNGTGTVNLRFVAPQPQHSLLNASVCGQTLYTSGLNEYTFLSYYAPDSEDGLFTFEFDAEVSHVDGALIQMGSRDLDAQGKYHESALPVSIDGNRVMVDARGVLRTLSILFPSVVEEVPEAGETVNEGLGAYDHDHLTLRLSNVIDINGNHFRAQQAGNIGSYSFYMNYHELFETINFDGDNKMAGDEVVAGEQLRLWLSSTELRFDGIQISYLALVDEDLYEPRTVMQPVYATEADPYEGVIISFELPAMPDVAEGQTVRITLCNAVSSDGIPHDIYIDFRAGNPASAIQYIHNTSTTSPYVYTLTGIRLHRDAVPAGLIVVGK